MTEPEHTPIPVVIAADDNFVVGAGVLMQSVLERTAQPVWFYLLHDGLAPGNRRRVEQTTEWRPDCQLTTLDVRDGLACLPGPLRTDAYSKLTYARLLAPELLPAARAVYLDADTLVRADLAGLYRRDLAGAAVAAVPDYGASSLSALSEVEREYFARMSPGDGPGYFNAGVMLMDLDAMRRGGVARRALEIIASGVTLRYADQCALNLAVEGRYAPLPERWNAIVAHRRLPHYRLIEPGLKRRVEAALADPAVIHYIGAKPWTAFPAVCKREFKEVQRRSPWRDCRPRWIGLPWRQQRALLKAWRREAFSLRVRRDEVSLQVLGRQALRWPPPARAAA